MNHTCHAFRSICRAAAALMAIFLTACANPGSGPDGGPYDETPPRIVSMQPAIGQRKTTDKKVTILFDEMIKVENPQDKIIISPPQTETPDIKVLGRRIVVEMLDTLRKNTTYTIDFSDAIVDANEGNPFGNFTYFFSTGEQLDTMEVAGNVLAAENLEPVKGILVGLHSDTTDTAFVSRPFDRVARTDSRGRFCIKGVAPGTYRIFALKDMDGDFRLTPGEMFAFLGEKVIPRSEPAMRADTLWHDSIHYDSIRHVRYTRYLPDDLVLLAFNAANNRRHFLKTQRDVPEWFRIYFTAPSDKRPQVQGLNFNADSLLLEQANATNDTITYWLRDTSIPQVDTLRMAYTYEAYDDSLARNTQRTDTLELTPRTTMARRLKQQAEAMEKWQKALERRHKRGDYSQETPPKTFLNIRSNTSRNITPTENIHLSFEEPIVRLDTAKLHLYLVVDSTKTEAPMRLKTAADVMTAVTVMGEWRYAQKYELEIDSAAVTGLSGQVNDKFKLSVSVGKEADYGSLFLHLPGADTTTTVQLLKSDTKVERQVRLRKGRADFFYLQPGVYYLRCFVDANLNGRWDTGDYAAGKQPEAVYYFPAAIEVRANWDIEQTWNVKELPLTRQKPEAITKQKADEERKPRNLNAERKKQLGRS